MHSRSTTRGGSGGYHNQRSSYNNHHHHNSHHSSSSSYNNSGTQNKINIPCKYYLSGTCRLGDQCRFLHSKSADNYDDNDEDYDDDEEYDEDQVDEEEEETQSSSYNNKTSTTMAAHKGNNDNNENKSADDNEDDENQDEDDDDDAADHEQDDEDEDNDGSSSSNAANSSELIGGSSLSAVKKNLDSVSQYLLSRRPLLHVIVLFAADLRVRKYAEEVQEIFLQRGINVFTQTETAQHQYVKPENLLEIITSSTANYVIVLGDRNMKNRTCQAKKSGKLIETDIDSHADMISDEWEDTQGDTADPLNSESVEDLTSEQLIELIQAVSGLRNITNKIEKIEQEVEDLQTWKFPHGKAHDNGDDHHFFMDDKKLARLTKAQNAAIHLHRDLFSANEAIVGIPVDDENAANSERGILLSYALENEQIGISKALKDRVAAKCEKILAKVEKMGDNLSDIGNKSPLWEAYKLEVKSKKAKAAAAAANSTAKQRGNSSRKPTIPQQQQQQTFKQNATRPPQKPIVQQQQKQEPAKQVVVASTTPQASAVVQKPQPPANSVSAAPKPMAWNSPMIPIVAQPEHQQPAQQTPPQQPPLSYMAAARAIQPQPAPIVDEEFPALSGKTPPKSKKPSILAQNVAMPVQPHQPMSQTQQPPQAIPLVLQTPQQSQISHPQQSSMHQHLLLSQPNKHPQPQHPPSLLSQHVPSQQSNIVQPPNSHFVKQPIVPTVASLLNSGNNSGSIGSGLPQQYNNQMPPLNPAHQHHPIFSGMQLMSQQQQPQSRMSPKIPFGQQHGTPKTSSSPAASDIWGSGFVSMQSMSPMMEYQAPPKLVTHLEEIWGQQPSGASNNPAIIGNPVNNNNMGSSNDFDMWSMQMGNNNNSGNLLFSGGSMYGNYYAPQQHHQPYMYDAPQQQDLLNDSFSSLSLSESLQQQQPIDPIYNKPVEQPKAVQPKIEQPKSSPAKPPRVNQPCVVCGSESQFECNVCISLRRKGIAQPPSFCCSPQHLQEHHSKYHTVKK